MEVFLNTSILQIQVSNNFTSTLRNTAFLEGQQCVPVCPRLISYPQVPERKAGGGGDVASLIRTKSYSLHPPKDINRASILLEKQWDVSNVVNLFQIRLRNYRVLDPRKRYRIHLRKYLIPIINKKKYINQLLLLLKKHSTVFSLQLKQILYLLHISAFFLIPDSKQFRIQEKVWIPIHVTGVLNGDLKPVQIK